MKLLTKEETAGLDSTTKTIEKWDTFLKKAVWNLGFKQELIDNMYPYEKGIPLKNKEYLPVSKTTGRVFFKMSTADKLAYLLASITGDYPSNGARIALIHEFLFAMWGSNKNFFFACFPDESEDTFTQVQDLVNTFKNVPSSIRLKNMNPYKENDILKGLWKNFIDNSDIISIPIVNQELKYITNMGLATEEIKQDIINDITCKIHCQNNLFIYNKNLTNDFKSLDTDSILTALSIVHDSNLRSKIRNNLEVYLQDYMVISLNPIDKLMCSTKQAFGSCMSIAKQDETRGTNSIPAFGLPALFPTDSVFMIFMTPGKHKNMYWETGEWNKPGELRDKEKAYKYLKMTCRALTYQCTLPKGHLALINDAKKELKNQKNVTEEMINKLNPESPRLLIGRQYSASGEDYRWERITEVLLGYHGISTGWGYLDVIGEIQQKNENQASSKTNSIAAIYRNTIELSRRGALIDNKAITIDRFANVRGIYYDNVAWVFRSLPSNRQSRREYLQKLDSPVQDTKTHEHLVTTGNSRYGSGGVTNLEYKSGLDMFKVMLGEQNYSYLDRNVKVCSICGDVVPDDLILRSDFKGNYYCDKCLEEHPLKKCKYCGRVYLTGSAEEKNHEIINLTPYLYPKTHEQRNKILMCATQITATRGTGDKKLCAHCGKLVSKTNCNIGLGFETMTIEGHKIYITLCADCLAKAVICDKCKELFFLEDTSEPMLLMQGKKVICPDCIETIRLKTEKKKLFLNIIKTINKDEELKEQIKIEKTEDPEETILKIKKLIENSSKITTAIKNIRKQINSFNAIGTVIKINNDKTGLPSTEKKVEEFDDKLAVECPAPTPAFEFIELPY